MCVYMYLLSRRKEGVACPETIVLIATMRICFQISICQKEGVTTNQCKIRIYLTLGERKHVVFISYCHLNMLYG